MSLKFSSFIGPIYFLIIFFSKLLIIKVSGIPYAPNTIAIVPSVSNKIVAILFEAYHEKIDPIDLRERYIFFES